MSVCVSMRECAFVWGCAHVSVCLRVCEHDGACVRACAGALSRAPLRLAQGLSPLRPGGKRKQDWHPMES